MFIIQLIKDIARVGVSILHTFAWIRPGSVSCAACAYMGRVRGLYRLHVSEQGIHNRINEYIYKKMFINRYHTSKILDIFPNRLSRRILEFKYSSDKNSD